MGVLRWCASLGDLGNTYLAEVPLYGSSRIGVRYYPANKRITGTPASAKTYTRSEESTAFEVANHLGNVLTTLKDYRQPTSGVWYASVRSQSDYYPFGLELPDGARGTVQQTGSSNSALGEYRYGLNGKEDDLAFGGGAVQDYGFRLYNRAAGRFLSLDPLGASYPWSTPLGPGNHRLSGRRSRHPHRAASGGDPDRQARRGRDVARLLCVFARIAGRKVALDQQNPRRRRVLLPRAVRRSRRGRGL